jgi:hypothetical protein
MPFLLGLDFILSTGVDVLPKEQVLRFIFDVDDVVEVPMLVGTRDDIDSDDDSKEVPIGMIIKMETQEIDTHGFNINPRLPLEQRQRLLEILLEYQDCFADSLEQIKIVDDSPVTIDLVEGAKPFRTQPYAASRTQNAWLKEYLNRLEAADLIEPSDSPWAAGIVLVSPNQDKPSSQRRQVVHLSKPVKSHPASSTGKYIGLVSTGVAYSTDILPPSFTLTSVAPEINGPLVQAKDPYRLCIDYRPLKKLMQKKAYPIPKINSLIASLAGSTIFSSFDALKGYWQRLLAEKNRPITAFTTIHGLYQWKRLPMSLTSAVAEWQSSMDRIFAPFLTSLWQ